MGKFCTQLMTSAWHCMHGSFAPPFMCSRCRRISGTMLLPAMPLLAWQLLVAITMI
jgi:hypothetical protein